MKLLWKTEVGYGLENSTVVGKFVYVTTCDGKIVSMICLDKVTGKEDWYLQGEEANYKGGNVLFTPVWTGDRLITRVRQKEYKRS